MSSESPFILANAGNRAGHREGIVVESVTKAFEGGKIRVLHGASLRIGPGQTAALWGASGSGKTTLLNMVGGLDTPDSGRLSTFGLNPALERDRKELRRNLVGCVFQLHHLIPYLTVRENILIPAVARGLSPRKAEDRVNELLETLHMTHRRNHRMQDLSGGERQRTAIGRALFNRPKVLLADEPTGALDEETGDRVFALMKELVLKEEMILLMATHEQRFAEDCDRIFQVREGFVREVGSS